MTWERLIESRIQDAMAAGAFDNLPGAGQPLTFDPEEQAAGENWLGFRILRENGLLPEWLMLAREIEDDEAHLAKLEARHADYVARAAARGSWAIDAPAIRELFDRFAAGARDLRRKQDRFNFEAPSLIVERPGIWVERRLHRLAERVRAAGAPAHLGEALGASPRSPGSTR